MRRWRRFAVVVLFAYIGSMVWLARRVQGDEPRRVAVLPQEPEVAALGLQAAMDREARLAQPHKAAGARRAVFVVGVEESGVPAMTDLLGEAATLLSPGEVSKPWSRHSVLDVAKRAWLQKSEARVIVARIDYAELLTSDLLHNALAMAARRARRKMVVAAVLRHPLPWALKLAQRNDSIPLRAHVERWMAAVQVYENAHARFVHSEALNRTRVFPRLLGEFVDVDTTRLPSVSANVGLVRCWLRGTPFSEFESVCELGALVDDFKREEYPARAGARHLEFWTLKREFECAIERYGYSLRVFEPLLACGRSCARAVRESRKIPHVFSEFADVSTFLPPEDDHGDVIVAFFKLYNNVRSAGAKGGMFARMAQVVHALDAAGFRVHFVCYCDMLPVREIDRSWAPKGTRFYEGSTDQQLDQLLPYSCGKRASIRALFLFVTSLTVDMHFRAAVKKAKFWWKEPRLGTLPSEQLAARVAEHSPNVKRVVLTDDIHSVRARQAFSDINEPVHIEYMLSWLKRREFAMYEAADYVLAVSPEDADLVRDELTAARPDSESTRYKAELPSVVWAPFVHELNQTLLNGTDQLLSNRSGLVYVGVPHPVAVPSVKWLVRHVLPRLRHILRRDYGKDANFVNRHAVLYLGGGGENARRWFHAVKKIPGSNHTVKRLGALSDEDLTNHLAAWRRVLTAPLFNNTGVATKIITGLSHGIPVVTTSGGCRGLGLPGDHESGDILHFADDVDGFARKTADLLTDDGLWRRMSSNGARHVRDVLSTAALTKTVRDAVLEHDESFVESPNTTLRYAPTSTAVLEASSDAVVKLEPTPPPAPSIARFDNAWYLAYRNDTRIVVRRFDDTWTATDNVALPKTPNEAFSRCPERKTRKRDLPSGMPHVDEPRLFVWREKLWLIVVARPRCFAKHNCDHCVLESMQYLVRNRKVYPVIVKGAPLGSNQRGFVPWVLGDDLYLSATIEPHLVLRVKLGSKVATASLVGVSTNDDAWRDLRALDGGCLTRPAFYPTSPAIPIANGSLYVGVVRTHVELGCLRFHEHVLYAFESTPPFAIVRRSGFLPLPSRAFAPATSNECRVADAHRVRTGTAKSAAGVCLDDDSYRLRISYSSGVDARVITVPWDVPFRDKPIRARGCPDEGKLPAECVVLATHAAKCAALRRQRRPGDSGEHVAPSGGGEHRTPAFSNVPTPSPPSHRRYAPAARRLLNSRIVSRPRRVEIIT